MRLPVPVEALWNERQPVTAEILAEIARLSQTQLDWRPSELAPAARRDGSAGILDRKSGDLRLSR